MSTALAVPTTTTIPPGVSVLRKLHAIMQECGYIQKDKRNEFHKYNYASEAAIKDKLHGAMVSHGVIPQFNVVAITEREIPKKDASKQSEWLTTCQIYYKFTCVDTGEYVDGTFFGTGIDPADKGLYKGITGAIKYILTSQFLIATGDDPEQDEGRILTRPEKVAKAKQVADDKIQAMKQSGTYREEPTTVQSIEDRRKKQDAEALAELNDMSVKHEPRKAAPPASGSYKMLSEFGALKEAMRALMGTDSFYYEILKRYGFAKSTEIPDKTVGAKVFKDLKAAHAEAKRYRGSMDELKDINAELVKQDGEAAKVFWRVMAKHGQHSVADVPPDVIPQILDEVRGLMKV